MYLAKIANGTVSEVGTIPTLFPNTSLDSANIDDDFLVANSCMRVKEFIPYDYETEKLVFTDPYIDGDFVYVISVEPLNENELNHRRIEKQIQIKNQREKLLQETDWTQSRDVTLDNDADWVTYRQELRDITTQEDYPHNVTWPTKPQ